MPQKEYDGMPRITWYFIILLLILQAFIVFHIDYVKSAGFSIKESLIAAEVILTPDDMSLLT